MTGKASPNLLHEDVAGRKFLWTRALGAVAPSSKERFRFTSEGAWRAFDPAHSKLAAALSGKEWPPLPQPGEKVLYLGAATGTTASHVADLVGKLGVVYAVEKSPRAFAQLLETAQNWPNMAPVLADVRETAAYIGWIPPVDAIYMDVPQVDQVEIARLHVRRFLRPGGRLFLALKLSSLGRERTYQEHLDRARTLLAEDCILEKTISLEPFYRRHAFIVGKSQARNH